MADFLDITGEPIAPNIGIDASYHAYLNTPLDIKTCNFYHSLDKLVVETITEYLERLEPEERVPGAIVVVLLPKDGYESLSPYPINDFSTAITNYDTKYYTFKDGIADENFVEVELKDSYVTELLFDQNILTAKRNNSLPDLTVELPFDVSDGLRSGGLVTWLTGFEYAVSSATYYLLGTRYVSDSGTVTLDASDATHDRIDVITVNDIGEIEVIKGTPAAEPLKPSIDPLTQIELTFIYVPANATEPTGVTGEVVYDENIEWTASANGVTVDFDSTTGPYNGMKCADVGTIGNYDTITFTASSPKNVADYETLSFFLKLKIAASNKNDVQIEFMLSGQPVSDRVGIGWNIGKVGTWQSIALLMSEFAFTSATFDAVKIIWRRTWFVFITHGGFYLDLVQLQKGVEQPETKGIELTGDVMGQGELGTPIPTELKEIITGGSYGAATKTLNITVDAKGRITAISENNISVADGREIELRENAGWVEWRYVGDVLWIQLFEIPTGGGGLDVEAGDGMDFVTNDPVTLGLPSTIDSTTENAVIETSHTHELGNIDISSISQAGGYGALYNYWAAIDARKITSSDDWSSLLTFSQLKSFFDYIDEYDEINEIYPEAGSRLKEKGTIHWFGDNLDATNEFNFNLLGAGSRNANTGLFVGIKFGTGMATLIEDGEGIAFDLYFDGTVHYSDPMPVQSFGITIRPSRLATEEELLLLDGTYVDDYVGNNFNTYKCVKIGTRVWLAANLNETQYRNGDWITGFDGGVYTPISDVDWAAKTTEAMCYYGDNEAYGGGETPLETLLHPPVTIHPDSASRASIDGNQVLMIEAQVGGQPYQVLTAKDIEAGTAQAYDLIIKARQDITIESIVVECDSGTLTGCTVTIGATAITFASGTFSVSTTLTEIAATANNIASAGDRVKINTSTGYTGTPTVLNIQLNYTVN